MASTKIINFIALVALMIFIAQPSMAKKYIIQAEGMMCQACVETITDGFKKIDESADVDIDLEKQIVTVDTGSSTEIIEQSTIEELFNDRGYKFISLHH